MKKLLNSKYFGFKLWAWLLLLVLLVCLAIWLGLPYLRLLNKQMRTIDLPALGVDGSMYQR